MEYDRSYTATLENTVLGLCVKPTRPGVQSSRRRALSCCRRSHFSQLLDRNSNTRSSDCAGNCQTSQPGVSSVFDGPP